MAKAIQIFVVKTALPGVDGSAPIYTEVMYQLRDDGSVYQAHGQSGIKEWRQYAQAIKE